MLASSCRSPGVGLLGTLGSDREAQGQAHTDSPPSHCPLPGLRSCCHPAHSSHRPHLCLPGAAAQILWDQSDHLSRRDGTLPRPRGVSVRVTAEIPEPLSAVWGQRRSPYPSSPLLCLASACGQPVPVSPFLSHPHSQHLCYLWDILGPLVPSALFVWGFFCCLPTALLATSSALASLSPVPYGLPGAGPRCPGEDGGFCLLAPCLVTDPTGLGGPVTTLQPGPCWGLWGWLTPSLCCQQQGETQVWHSEALSSLSASGPTCSSADPRAAWHPRSTSQPPQTPPAPAWPKLTSARRLLGSSGIVPHTNDDRERTPWARGSRLAALPCWPGTGWSPPCLGQGRQLRCCPPAPARARQHVSEDPAFPRPRRAPPPRDLASGGGVRSALFCGLNCPHWPFQRGQGRPQPRVHRGCLTAPPCPALPCTGGLQAPAPLLCAPLCVVSPRDQRTGLSVTLIYNKEWNKHRAWCPSWAGGGDAVSPPAVGGLRLGAELPRNGGRRARLVPSALHQAGESSPCSVPPA